MSERPINLRAARKRKAREEKRRTADANAARHGQSRAEREGEVSRLDLEARRHEAHRLEDDGPDG